MFNLTKSAFKTVALIVVAVSFAGCRYTQEVCWNNSGWFAVVMSDRLGEEFEVTDHTSGEISSMTLRQEPTGEFRFEISEATTRPSKSWVPGALLKACDMDGVSYVESKSTLLGEISYSLYKVLEVSDPTSGHVGYEFALVTFDEEKLAVEQIPFEAKRTGGRANGLLMDLVIQNDGVSADVLMSTRADHQDHVSYSIK